jgi:hypothetical protein
MSSYVAGLVSLIEGTVFVPPIGGVSPYPLLPTAVLPFINVREVFGRQLQNLSTRSGMIETIMQIDIWSKDYEEAYEIRKTANNALIDTFGSVGSLIISGPIRHVTDAELYDGTRRIHQLISRFHIWWEA